MATSWLEGRHVLVAGGSGFVGTNLIRRLLELGATVRATLHERPSQLTEGRIEYIRADLTSTEDCQSVMRDIEVVFMCAASTSGAAVIRDNPLVHVTPNVVMNARTLEAAYHAGVAKFVWLSSNAAYPPTGRRPVREEELFAGEPYDAYFPVAWMKRYTEVLCRMFSEKLPVRMPVVVVRPSNLYGPYDDFDPRTSHVTAALVRKVVERSAPIEVWGDGHDIRDILYIDDFIDGLLLAAERLDGYDPVNIGLGQAFSVREILAMLLELEGYSNAELRFDASKPSMIPVRLIDVDKARTRLGFSPQVDPREGLRRTLAWYRASRVPGG